MKPGADPGFSNRRGAKDYVLSAVHITSAGARMLLAGEVQCPLKGPGNSRTLDALSCYLSLILKHSDTKRDFKNKQT